MSNTTSTTSTLPATLLDGLKAVHAESVAWAEEIIARGGWAGYAPLEGLIQTCLSEGITTMDEFRAHEAWINFNDTYKEAHGIRPRWTCWRDDSAEGWEEATDIAARNAWAVHPEGAIAEVTPEEVAADLAAKGIGGFSAADLARWEV